MESSVEVRASAGNAAVRRWFDVNSGADYCAVRPKTLRKAYKDGKIPRAKLGHKFVFDRRDLDAWVQGELIREE